MTTPRTGHPTESELNWQRSPMWLAMMDAAAECGLTDRMDEARITDAKVWARIGDKHWPSEDKATRDRFHALWTANVQARCGLDPETATPEPRNLVAINAQKRAARKMLVPLIVERYDAGETGAEIGRALGIGKNSALRILRDEGLIPARREVPHAA